MHIQSPDTSDAGIERACQAFGLTAPRVTQEDLDTNIVHTDIVEHTSKGGQVLRWAVLTTKSGYAVTGDPSVSVSPENDKPEIGIPLAIANARSKLWPLMGYELKQRLAFGKEAA